MASKVFKFPDGKGGWTFKVQEQDGSWSETDESGNPIQEGGANPLASPVIPKERAKGRRGAKDSRDTVHLNLKMPSPDYLSLSRYVHWRSLNEDIHLTVTEVVVTAVKEFLKKDRKFMEYQRSREAQEWRDTPPER